MDSRDPVRPMLQRAASLGYAIATLSCLPPGIAGARVQPGLRRAAERLLDHPPLLCGYLDGRRAQALTRDALQGALPDDAPDLAVVCVAGALFARTVAELAGKPSLAPVPPDVAERACAHAEDLFARLSDALRLEHAPDA